MEKPQMNGVLTMSRKEIDRLMILKQIEESKITVLEAADILELSQRQIYRILKRIKTEGTKGIIHKLRGRKSNRGYPAGLKEKVIGIYRKQYSDYVPTLYSEMLEEYHNIPLNRKTVRGWLRQNSITTQTRKKDRTEEKDKGEAAMGVASV